MKTFKIHWYTGGETVVHGNTIGEALMLAGYGGGIARVIDYWEEVVDDCEDNN